MTVEKIVPWYIRKLPEIAALVFVLLCAGLLYWNGGKAARKEAKAAKTEIKAVAKSNGISRRTQDKVEQEGAQSRRQADADEDKLDEDIRANPGDDAPVSDDGMRIAQEAYERAVRAACRVQREGECPSAAAPADVDK